MENAADYHEFYVNSAKYFTLLTKKFLKRKVWQKTNPLEIRSYIPGSITEVYARPGQKLKAGEAVLTLDAMKMYNKVDMPQDGVIKKIFVNKGDRVPKDALLFVIE